MFSLLCVILLYLAHISSALPPSSPSALLIPPPPQLLRNSTNGTVGASVHDLGRYGCTMLPDWFDNSRGAPELNYEDCELAMRQLMADLADFGREKYKWLSLGTPCYLTRGGPRQCIRTPKRYTTSKSILTTSVSYWFLGPAPRPTVCETRYHWKQMDRRSSEISVEEKSAGR